MQDIFRGRQAELKILDKKFKQNGFIMTVLYGRRIGKTMLINKFMHEQSCKTISFTSVERGEMELLSLMTEAVLTAPSPELLGSISFNSFETLFEFIGKQAKNERMILFILCGSLVSFMKDEVLAESAPLHRRSHLELKLKPFNYLKTAEFLEGYSLEAKGKIRAYTIPLFPL